MTARGSTARDGSPRAAAVLATLVLAVVYSATAAPDVTFWDAGEFLAAFATFGIPHPPGTPLFVAIGRVWVLGAGLLGAREALAGNLFSAACTAAAGGCTAWLVARWTRDRGCGVAAAICAGTMTTVWANATEAEVYAASLALACAALVAAEHAGRRLGTRGGAEQGARATAATAYALALAVPLHLSALVVSPAAAWLASVPAAASDERATLGVSRGFARTRAASLAAAAVSVAGVGTGRGSLVALGGAGLIACAVHARRARRGATPGADAARPAAAIDAGAIALASAVAVSATLILLVRAAHDPWLNQGDPSTWARLVSAVARRQYAVAPLWPRQAPWWLQLANLGEWADWQVALGVAPDVAPSWTRTPITIAFVLLGAHGSAWHRGRDRRSWVALLLVLVAGSIGVACYLNLKAGPSFGAGVLPDSAPHEARERDYFFVLAWWAWGVWAGIGAVASARRLTRSTRAPSRAPAGAIGVGLASLPLALNWSAATRTRLPAAYAAGAYARALLENAPARAVVFVNADNDTYPLWQAQTALGLRRDVTTVTVSLLPARWYRAELARRGGLLDRHAVDVWLGSTATVAAVAARAARAGRPVAVTLATDDATRAAIADGRGTWQLRGLTVEWVPDRTAGRGDAGVIVIAPPLSSAAGAALGDRRALAAAAARVPRIDAAWLRDSTGDGVVAWAYRQLACPAAVLAASSGGPVAPALRATPRPRSLEGPCEAR